MDSAWSFYDKLIEGVDSTLIVDHFSLGVGWTEVWAGPYTGVAMTIKERGPVRLNTGIIEGKTLKDVSALIKSWDFLEASLGAAALNCFYNSIEKVTELGGLLDIDLKNLVPETRRKKNAFIAFQNQVENKKVLCIGHFPHIEKQLAGRCELKILERNPRKGDYPDSACEYLIPEQDFCFITGMTLTNKTLPRLLALAGKNVKVSIVGPSICLAPQLLDMGADNLSGFCVIDRKKMDEVVRYADKCEIFDAGVMVSIGER